MEVTAAAYSHSLLTKWCNRHVFPVPLSPAQTERDTASELAIRGEDLLDFSHCFSQASLIYASALRFPEMNVAPLLLSPPAPSVLSPHQLASLFTLTYYDKLEQKVIGGSQLVPWVVFVHLCAADSGSSVRYETLAGTEVQQTVEADAADKTMLAFETKRPLLCEVMAEG
jgi:hypothetical protein